MNRIFVTLLLSLTFAQMALAGVTVTSVDLKTNGPTGYVNVTLNGNSNSLPDVRVHGNTIEVVIDQADGFSAITKNVSGAQLSANALNGKAIVKAILPYDVPADAVNLNWKNKTIEVAFPRGVAQKKVTTLPANTMNMMAAKEMMAAPMKTTAPKKAEVETAMKVEVKAKAKTETKAMDTVTSNKISKDNLNEDYLNNLMKESTDKAEAPAPKAEVKNDEVKIQQSALAKPAAPQATMNSQKTDGFSFAGYALKFGVFLALVLGLFYGVVQVLKKGVFSRGKLGFLNNSQLIEVLSTTYVAPKRSLMIVKAHKQIFLVANSETGLEFLAEMTDTSGLIKEGEKLVTGSNFDTNLGREEGNDNAPVFKIKENILESTPVKEESALSKIAVAKDIVKFSDELKKKAKKLKPIEFN